MPRFVILAHDWPSLHWDLMLENEAALRTWRLASRPDSCGPIAAEPLPDHRAAYLDYEGPVGGGRGEVTRWDAGDYTLVAESDRLIEIRLNGKRLCGQATLRQSADSGVWQFELLDGEG